MAVRVKEKPTRRIVLQFSGHQAHSESLTLAQKTKALTSFLIQDNLKIGGGLMRLKFSKKKYYVSSSSLKSD